MESRRHPRRLGPRRVLALLSAVTLLGPGAALARADGVIAAAPAPTITLSSGRAGSAAALTVNLAFAAPVRGDSVRSLAILLPSGMTLDTAAVPARCAPAALTAGDCPAGAQIGAGTAILTPVGTLLTLRDGSAPLSAHVDLYLMAPTTAGGTGAPAGVGVELTDPTHGIALAASGDIVTTPAPATPGRPGAAPTTTTEAVELTELPDATVPDTAGAPLSTLLSAPTAFTLSALTLGLGIGPAPALTGTSPSTAGAAEVAGPPLLRLPDACVPATVTVGVSTVTGATGATAARFTPTGCGAPTLAFTLTLDTTRGPRAPVALTLSLARGLSFTPRAAGGALRVQGAMVRARLLDGHLLILIHHPGPRLSISLASAGIAVGLDAPAHPRLHLSARNARGQVTVRDYSLALAG
ncbi:hypothetical protein [Conexibacter sp. DBS9H8]|uniref:hypothetical protein n=1 Tax=Conexibacter sp. DBS9H8 TaxID=2937801 RepID=UPI00200E3FE4|nr:hypothetical protein [Conexibacter sp. DBS9H8]